MADNKTYYYARVSSTDQNLARQISEFEKCPEFVKGISERDIIEDKESGKNLERAGYQTLRNQMLRKGDTLVITSIDRLSRSKEDIKAELQHYKEVGVRVKILNLPTTTMTFDEKNEWIQDMISTIIIEFVSTMAEQERLNIKQRQADGIAAKKKRGEHTGRPTLEAPANWKQVYDEWQAKKITAVEAMKLTGLKRTSFYKLAEQEKGGK